MTLKKTITAILLVSIFSYSFGLISYRSDIFPIPQVRLLKKQFSNNSNLDPNCPVVNSMKLRDLNLIAETAEIKNIFWGDSVVEFMHDSRFYEINNFREVAQSGQVIYCAMKEMDYVLNFNPDTVIVYIGGNDADGQSWYGPEQAAVYYEEVIDNFLINGITPIIHLIHEGHMARRDRNYVTEYNQKLTQLAERKGVKVIPDVKDFSFPSSEPKLAESSNPYTYDGEHLKPDGYKLWVTHIKNYIGEF